jgi:GNAT superfamily N-acetyltransferase
MSEINDEMEIEIRLMTKNDLGPLVSLKHRLGWNQTERDLKRLLELNPHGCFTADYNGEMVGTITSIVYDNTLAWIGMMLVDPRYRRRSIASRLMGRVLEYLYGRGTNAIKLDATPEGFPLYQSMGFVAETLIERWECFAAPHLKNNLQDLDDALLPAVYALDKLAFGVDRSFLIDALMKGANSKSAVSVSSAGNHLNGFALSRPGGNANYVGPIVAKDRKSAADLLEGMLAQSSGKKVYVDFNTGFNFPLDYLLKLEFVKQRDLVRMSLGNKGVAGTSKLILAIAGPELG